MRRHRLLFILFIVDVALVFAHIFLRKKLGFFNLDKEGSLKAVYSGFQLLVSGGVAALIAYLLHEKAKRWLWGVTSAGFVYLGLDEMMVIHERIGFVLNRWSGLTGYWGESFNWLLYFTPFIAAALLVYFLLIRMVSKYDRRCAIGILFGAAFFVASIALEVIGGKILGTRWYQTEIIAEEALQLVGESLFLVSFLLLLQKKFYTMYVRRV